MPKGDPCQKRVDPYQKRVVNNPCHQMEKLMKEILCKHPVSLISVLGEACLLLSPRLGLIGTEGSRETGNTHRNPTVKHSLTMIHLEADMCPT